MVGVAQLVEPRIVAPVVVGSNPIAHPIKSSLKRSRYFAPQSVAETRAVIAEHRNKLSRNLQSSTVNRYLAALSHALKTAS